MRIREREWVQHYQKNRYKVKLTTDENLCLKIQRFPKLSYIHRVIRERERKNCYYGASVLREKFKFTSTIVYLYSCQQYLSSLSLGMHSFLWSFHHHYLREGLANSWWVVSSESNMRVYAREIEKIVCFVWGVWGFQMAERVWQVGFRRIRREENSFSHYVGASS